MSESSLEIAKRLFNIQDVYVSEVSAFADRDHDPSLPVENINIQIKATPKNAAEQFWIEVGGKKTNCLRYHVETGLRILKPGVETNVEVVERNQLLAEISAI